MQRFGFLTGLSSENNDEGGRVTECEVKNRFT